MAGALLVLAPFGAVAVLLVLAVRKMRRRQGREVGRRKPWLRLYLDHRKLKRMGRTPAHMRKPWGASH